MLVIIGFLFTVLVFVFVGRVSGMIAFFVDMPSALLILVPLFFFLFVTKSGGIIGRYIKSSFKKEYAYTGTELESIALAIQNTVKFILATGGFGFVAGLIGCLAYVGSLERFGPNLAISLITMIYAIAVSFFIFFPVQAWAENKIKTLPENGRS